MAAPGSNWSPSPKKPHITPPEGYENVEGPHDLCRIKDILTFYVFPRLGWESKQDVEQSCKKRRLWCRDNPKAARENAMLGEKAAMKKWIVDNIIYNDDKDPMAWLEGDMSAYCDGFPLLFKGESHD